MTLLVAAPDGVEVVQTTAEAAASARPPLLVVDAVNAYLDSIGFDEGELRWRRIGDGQSNITYELRRGADRVAMRRGPRPPLPPSAHDMLREARIQKTLAERGVPVPEVRAVCDDPSIIGVPFYLMDFVDGDVITDALPDAYWAPDARFATARAAIDALAELHLVPVEGEVAAIGRPDGYLHRQVDRFRRLWTVNSRRSLPQVDAIGERLAATLPESARASVVHGDYRLGNIMFRGPGDVAAILDWEMATLGDPLADLGYFVAMYSQPGRAATVMDLTPVTAEPGFPSGNELVARYAELTGADVSQLAWYQALALWKAAVFCEAIYTRWLDGERPDDTFGPRLESGIPQLLEAAEAQLGRLD
jgi:aminoglycoside phosphotransferase (APT) family kinase protein